MKILFINTLYDPDIGGGAEIVLKKQVHSLAALGHSVAVLTIGRAAGILWEHVGGIDVCRVGYRNVYFHHAERKPSAILRSLWHAIDIYNPWMRSEAANCIEQFRPEIAVCHNLAGWSVSVLDVLFKHNVPIVQVLHDQYFLCVKSTMFKKGRRCKNRCAGCRVARWPHRAISNRVATLVGVSRFVLSKIISYNFFEKAQLFAAIPNASNVGTRSVEMPACTARHPAEVIFGFIGNLASNKGIDVLLKTFTSTRQPHWRLLVAGTGEKHFQADLQARHDDSRITFLGRVDASDFYTRIDACIVPSIWEDTLPSVVFEALLHGVPVLGSRLGGISEMIDHEINGLLFSPNVEEILGAMELFARTKDLWAQRAESIRSRASSRFGDLRGWALQWERLLSTTLTSWHARQEGSAQR